MENDGHIDEPNQTDDKTVDDGPVEYLDDPDLVMDVSDEEPPYNVNRDLPDKGL